MPAFCGAGEGPILIGLATPNAEVVVGDAVPPVQWCQPSCIPAARAVGDLRDQARRAQICTP